MPAKHYSVIVAPSDGSKSYQLHISFRAVVALGVLFVLIGSAVVFLVATYGSLAWKVRDWEDVRARCAELERETAEVVELREELGRLREMDRSVRNLIGLPERGPDGSGAEEHGAESEGIAPPGTEAVFLPEAMIPDDEIRERLSGDLRTRRHALPWPVEGFVSSTFGEERAEGGVHSGIDIAAPRNTVIEAPLAGTVRQAGWSPVYGYLAVIDHGNDLFTVYGHNSRLVVREGDRVKTGDAIAFLGNTGMSSAPHLHFEVRKDGYAVDPIELLRQKNGR